ncbi:MAG: 50S ribosomal protein L10, partial [Candidatus Gracilibacteria bacterium]
VFSGYSGIDVKSMTTLRKKLRAQKVDYLIFKKTLIHIGAKEAGLPAIDEKLLEGPIAVAISYDDEMAPIKVLYAVSKDKALEDKLKIFGAYMEGKVLTKAEVLELAKLPSRQELLGKLVYIFNSPVSGFHHVLHEVMRKFVGVVDAYAKKRPAEVAPVVAAPAVVAETTAPETPAADAGATPAPAAA